MVSLTRLKTGLARYQPNSRSVSWGMALVASYLIVGKLAGAAKEMAIAYRFGVGIEVDAFLNVANLMFWPGAVWLSVLSSVLVPLVAQIRHQAKEELPRFRAELLGQSLLLCPLLALLAWLIVPLLLGSPSFGLTPAIHELAETMIEPLIILVPLGIVINLFSVWLLASGRHINTLLEGTPALVLGIAVAIPFSSEVSVKPLVWGTAVGFGLHLIALSVCLVHDKNVELPLFTRRSPYWSTFWQGFCISVVGQMLMSLIMLVDQYFAAQLGAGTLSTLSYANRILMLVIGLGATAVSRATLPVFSAVVAEGKTPAIAIANRWVRVLFVLGLLSFAFAAWFAPEIVRLLFQRGAFSAADTTAVAEVLRYGLLQVPVYFPSLVLVSFLSSYKQYKLIAIGAILNLAVKMAANHVLVPAMGINGIAAATSVMYAFSFAFLWFVSAAYVRKVRP